VDRVIERCEQAGMDESLLSKSFFEYLYERFPDNNKMLLDTQYRMPAQIADLLSEWFYEGKYMSDKVKRNMPSRFA
jgi:superfamily I DNA and/or RNA helicase